MPTLTYDDAFEALVDDGARMTPEAVVGYLQTLDAWNVQARLGELRLPTLILGGGRDVLIPRVALERMARELPSGRLVIWPSVGHAPQLEQPGRFMRLLKKQLGQAPIAPRSGSQFWLRRLRNLFGPRRFGET